jgi:nitrous oxide reductase accessory protein NosL
MSLIHRRRLSFFITLGVLVLFLLPAANHAADWRVDHPLTPPDPQYHGRCPVCGMKRSMWARTWIAFDPSGGVGEVCSFHCLADWAEKSGGEPSHVRLSLYHRPEKTVSAQDAVVVIGSSLPGTMSPVSKVVFDDRSEAAAFVSSCGGAIGDYAEALLAARAGLEKENRAIHARRLKKGKIVEPRETDSCMVCGMYPARYPYGKCQIRTGSGTTLHFCSTQCMFAFLGRPERLEKKAMPPQMIWVVDRSSGMWISGRAAFYVVGSTEVFGPMGYEALPFNSMADADRFSAGHGGETLIFDKVSIEKVVPGWTYPSHP